MSAKKFNDSLGDEICMGIRKGLYGGYADADKNGLGDIAEALKIKYDR